MSAGQGSHRGGVATPKPKYALVSLVPHINNESHNHPGHLLKLWPQTYRCQKAFETSIQYSLVQGLRPEHVERTAVHGHARLLAHLGTLAALVRNPQD